MVVRLAHPSFPPLTRIEAHDTCSVPVSPGAICTSGPLRDVARHLTFMNRAEVALFLTSIVTESPSIWTGPRVIELDCAQEPLTV